MKSIKSHAFTLFECVNFFQLACLGGSEINRGKKFLINNGCLVVIFDFQVLSWRGQNSETWNLNLIYRNHYLFTVWIPPSFFAWWRIYCNNCLLCLDDWLTLTKNVDSIKTKLMMSCSSSYPWFPVKLEYTY